MTKQFLVGLFVLVISLGSLSARAEELVSTVPDLISAANVEVMHSCDDVPDYGGSGVVIGRDKLGRLLILTDDHVIDKSCTTHQVESFEVIHEAAPGDAPVHYKVDILGKNKSTDIALLRTVTKVTKGNFSIVKLAKEDAKLGDEVWTIGSPLLDDDLLGCLNKGTISRVNVHVGHYGGPTRIAYNAGILPGMSGGGVYNLQGELVGLNELVLVDNGSSMSQFGMMVKVSDIWTFLKGM